MYELNEYNFKMSSTDVLSAERVLDIAAAALSGGDSSLKTPYEAVALIGHACMAAVGFRLVGLGEDHKLGSFSFPYLSMASEANS